MKNEKQVIELIRRSSDPAQALKVALALLEKLQAEPGTSFEHPEEADETTE